MRNTLLRRGSMQTNKPPPPIRRTSSITNTNTIGQITSMGSMENLPPPPAFLLEPNQNNQQGKHGIGKSCIHMYWLSLCYSFIYTVLSSLFFAN